MIDTSLKERGVIFRDWEVQATLKNLKTQFRRVIKPQPGPDKAIAPCHYSHTGWAMSAVNSDGTLGGCNCRDVIHCPFGAPGTRLWVRETWGLIQDGMESPVCYRADKSAQWRSDPAIEEERRTEGFSAEYVTPKTWLSSSRMPRWAARLFLRVVSVRVERVQDISEIDAQAEGVDRLDCGQLGLEKWVSAFRNQWITSHGHESYNANPWVWVVEFEREQA